MANKEKKAPKGKAKPSPKNNKTGETAITEQSSDDGSDRQEAVEDVEKQPEQPRAYSRRNPPPKKTGKSGIGPKIDPLDDFDTPTRREPETKPIGGTSLLVKQPEKPGVVGKRMKVFYDKPLFSKKSDIITVSLLCSVPLEKEHEDLLPKIIRDAYHDVSKKGRKTINLKTDELPGQRACFYLSHDSKDETLTLPAARLTNVSLSEIQRKGEGSSRKVIRLSFRLQVKLSREVAHFAEHNLANDFWVELEDTQEALFDEESEEE